MQIIQLFSLFLFCITTATHCIQLEFKEEALSDTSKKIKIQLTPAQNEWIYADMVKVDMPSPALHMSAINSSVTPSDKFDPQFQQTKRVFDRTTTLETTISLTENQKEATAPLRVIVYTNRVAAPQEFLHEINFAQSTAPVAPMATPPAPTAPAPTIPQPAPKEHTASVSWSDYFSDIVKHTQSTPIRLIIVFILGVLLSLTPCIYPMVPITAGILQSQGSSSLLYNFLLALSYSCGMATTFAVFGLLASCTGPLCGQLLMQPLFIAGLIAVLAYLALSLLGLYELKIPAFFQTSSTSFKGGSLLSTFAFGAASGTIASPCVSPGLALLLSVVAALGNKILGFLMLFVFGVGLSMPLLIVGTFSSSLNLLPRAGLWMVEIKKLFGFIMLGMCLYYASYIVPLTYMLWITALFLLSIAAYYLYHSLSLKNTLRLVTTLLGFSLIAAATVVGIQAFNATFSAQEKHTEDELWLTDYAHALQEARAEHKKLFIDFWATFCPICLAINKKVLTRPATLAALRKQYVLLKVDGTYASNETYAQLRTLYNITGFPTFLVVDPTTEQVTLRMGGEIYEMPEAELISKIAY
jgi:thiol:disulfide interchange protein